MDTKTQQRRVTIQKITLGDNLSMFGYFSVLISVVGIKKPEIFFFGGKRKKSGFSSEIYRHNNMVLYETLCTKVYHVSAFLISLTQTHTHAHTNAQTQQLDLAHHHSDVKPPQTGKRFNS